MEKLLNDPMPTPSAIGKKRPAPEDFEVIRSQAFTVESKPSEPERTTTPRARKVLSSIQSGFTPTRNHAARPIVPMPSPKQDAPSSMRMAINNSGNVFSLPPAHHSADQPTKRGWLGKIRGTSSHSTPTQKGVLRPAYTMTH
ncbi:hypothetical protein DL96DRAFT_65919 [Flagelloscypha sp. PMI_526]|nr:hypothetical protein DL96DRAFT_65919 [Flagelloscypha sp. PMI_526]